MRLPELVLFGALAACTSERGPSTDVKVAMSTQKAATERTLTTPEVRSVEEVAADAAWIVSVQSQVNSLGDTNCENAICPSIRNLCTIAPELCVEAFNCATDHFGSSGEIGYRNVFRGLEDELKGTTDGLPQGAVNFIVANGCISN